MLEQARPVNQQSLNELGLVAYRSCAKLHTFVLKRWKLP